MQAKEPLTENLEDGETSEHGESGLSCRCRAFRVQPIGCVSLPKGSKRKAVVPSLRRRRVTVSPMAYLLGYKTDGDLGYVSKASKRNVHLIAVGPQGTSVAQSGVRTMLFERRYLSVLIRQDNGTYKYESVKKSCSSRKRSCRFRRAV